MFPGRINSATLAGEYLVPRADSILFGSTQDYFYNIDDLSSKKPDDVYTTFVRLKENLIKMCPALLTVPPLRNEIGVRITAPRTHFGKLPFVRRHPTHNNISLVTGAC